MFGNMLGDLEAKKFELAEKLLNTPLKITIEGVTIAGNAAREVTSVTISPELVNDLEALETLLEVSFNRFIAEVSRTEAAESEAMFKKMLPPGFGNMFDK